MTPFRTAGGPFAPLHAELMGASAALPVFDPSAHAARLLSEAQRTWGERARTEFRSIQIMARFLTEVVGAGDPIDVYAGAVELVADEVRHTALCLALLGALGGQTGLPEPVRLQDPERFLRSGMPERALATAISMVLINERISVAFISDLAARCETPAVKHVLDATLADEDGHGDFGRAYVEKSLARFPISSLPAWRHLVTQTLLPHRRSAEAALADVPEASRRLDAWPEPERAALGLFSPQRQALVFRAAEAALLDDLAALGLVA